jgi:hypothetical protein
MSYPNRNSIQLQDLPPDRDNGTEPHEHRQTFSDRGRHLRALASGHRDSRYAPLVEASPSPTRHASRPQINTVEEEDVGSPIDPAQFQNAIGFGMDFNFQGDTSPPLTPPIPTPASSQLSYSQYGQPSYQDRLTSDDRGYFSPSYDDTARLTDVRNLQPISGAAAAAPAHQRNRSSFHSVHFLSPVDTPATPRYSENLGQVEAATGSFRDSRGRKRSLSPAQNLSPLNRAGTIVRNMSQRVVNVSNDSQVAERTIQRKSTVHSRLQAPPSLPALSEYATDGPSSPSPSTVGEKPPSPVIRPRIPSVQRHRPPNPLRGRSLGIFPPESKVRMRLCDLLVHPATEPLLLLLIVVQTVLLAVDARSKAKYEPGIVKHIRNFSPFDYALLGLFIVYTIEVVIRIIVSGFIINPVEYSTINRKVSLRDAVMMKVNRLFGGPERQSSQRRSGNKDDTMEAQQPSVLRTFTTAQIHADIGPGDHREQQRARLAHRAYLRHSFNRTDFLAVISFWIAFVLGVIGIDNTRVILVFNMLSCLRIIRLLNLTSGTSVSVYASSMKYGTDCSQVILRSLKKAAPLLVNVAFLIGFFWLLFSIVGVQNFKSSMRRNCVWQGADPTLDYNNTNQFCGGHRLADNSSHGYIQLPGHPAGPDEGKGFLCPPGSFCVERSAPFNGTKSFDNILQSLELVFVVMSSNTWSNLLYTMADTDYLVSSLFFIIAILILSLWLISLLIAVITSSFQIIREESKTSAFTGEVINEETAEEEHEKQRVNNLKRFYDKTTWVWIAVIAYGLVSQMMTSANMSDFRRSFIEKSETIVTFILLLEILVRLAVDWRHFFNSRRNITDLIIAITTTIIQIPAIKHAHGGKAYAWLTIFQIVRVYRIVLAVPVTRDLIVCTAHGRLANH